jgi:hypothetical protein
VLSALCGRKAHNQSARSHTHDQNATSHTAAIVPTKPKYGGTGRRNTVRFITAAAASDLLEELIMGIFVRSATVAI